MDVRGAIKNLATLYVGVLVFTVIGGSVGTASQAFSASVTQNVVDLTKITGTLNGSLVPVTNLVLMIGGFWTILEIIGADRLLSFE